MTIELVDELIEEVVTYGYDEFRSRLKELINSESMENASGTPDFILADYLVQCLMNYDRAVETRGKWYS